VSSYPVVEAGTSRSGRWLRARRLRLALLIGAAETLYILFSDRGWFWALGVAALVIAFWWFVGRSTRFDWLRQLSWTLAASQLIVILVPLVGFALATLAVVAMIAVIAIVVLMLLLDRR
jgi:hypothetical protein